jgi:hypothetical protein
VSVVTPALDPGPSADGFVRLVATVPLHSDPQHVVAVLGDRISSWLGTAVEHPPVTGMRRYEVDLRLRVGGAGAGLTTFSKAAYLDLGRPHRTPTGWEAEISWRASSAAPLFPVFSGRLSIGPDELRVDGLYAPPGGVVGRVADRMLLHVAANGTARWFLSELDRAALGAAG